MAQLTTFTKIHLEVTPLSLLLADESLQKVVPLREAATLARVILRLELCEPQMFGGKRYHAQKHKTMTSDNIGIACI